MDARRLLGPRDPRRPPCQGQTAFTTVQTVVYLVDELLALFGGRSKPVIARLVESGKLSVEDIREAEAEMKRHPKKGGAR